MSKIAGVLGLVLVGSSVAVGGFYLFKINRFDSTLPKNVQEFKDNGHEEGCVQSLFYGLKKMSDAGNSDSNIDSNFLSNGDKDKTVGCLVVNWNRKDYGSGTSKKGKGSFRFLWSIKHTSSNKGFVVFASAEPVESNKKFKWTGVAYALEKKSNESQGTLNKKIEIKEGATDGKDVEFKNKFPKLKIADTNTQDGGFEETEDTNICDNGGCKDANPPTKTSFEGYGIWEGEKGSESNPKLEEGSDKLDEWGKATFGEDKGNMKEVIKEMKGKWVNKVRWYGK